MRSRVLAVCAGGMLAVSLLSCASSPKRSAPNLRTDDGIPSPGGTETASTDGRMAPGFYELGQERVRVVGVLDHREIEGGVWLIVRAIHPKENVGEILAVIANADRFGEHSLRSLKGKLVVATGRHVDGASIRMMGPEIEITSIGAVKDIEGASQ